MEERVRGAGRRRIATVAVALSLVFGAAAWLVAGWLERKPLARNAIVLLVDTLRADHLSLYGYARATSPNLDRLAAAHGVVFENARAQAPCTFPSVNSLLTGRSPLRFLTDGEPRFGIPPDVPTLAGVLGGAGFATAAVSASPIVRATPSPENPEGGFGAGFESFDETCYWGSGACVTGRAVAALDALREPFFLYAHYLDPHDPYTAPAAAAVRFAGEAPATPGREFLAQGDPNPVAVRLYEQRLDAGLAPEELGYLVDRYDEEIAFWDEQLAVLLWALNQRGLFERTVVVVVADHGEQFLEHRGLKHCRSLYDEELRVPFVVLLPDLAPRRVAEPVTNLDLLPTLLDLVGVAERPDQVEGRSLRPLVEGREPRGEVPAPLQRSWWNGDRAVSDGRYKFVASPAWQSPRLFDLERDPGERENLVFTERATMLRMRDGLARWVRDDPGPEGAEDLAQRLRALGYLQ